MTARRLAAGVLAAGFLIPATPVAAAPAERTLTVSGPGNTYADVSFPTRVRFATERFSKEPPEFEGTGSYSGVYVTPLSGRGPSAGTVLLRGIPDLEPFPLAEPGWLPPGRYRVHLVGDAAGTVRMRATGLRRDLRVVTGTRPSPVVATWPSRGVAGLVTAPADRSIVPITVRPSTVTVVANVHDSMGLHGRRDTCIRRRSDGRSPCLDGSNGRGWYWSLLLTRWRMGSGGAYYPGMLPTGDLEVEFLDATVGVAHGFHRFVMTIG